MDLKIIKAGRTGTGILIEQDAGFISPTDERNRPLIREFLNPADGKGTETLIVYVVLQKYNVKNRNGRIYGEELLKRQNEIFQQAIRERRAIGELDHPECHRKSAEILTFEGWKPISDITDEESVYTLNPNTNEIELQNISKKIVKKFNGTMISIKGRNVDLQVTPNHKFWVIDRNERGRFITAQEIHDKTIIGLDKMYIPKLGVWTGNNTDTFILKGLKESEIAFNQSYSNKAKLMGDLEIPMDLWVKFMGIYLSEGCVVTAKTKKRISMVLENGDIEYGFDSPDSGYVCKVTQKKKDTKAIIKELFESLPFDFKEIEYPDGKVDFKINDARLHKYLKQFGKAKDKFIPNEIKVLSSNYLNDFINWFILGDGRVRGNSREIFSVSTNLINDLQEILIKCGLSGNIRTEDRNFDRIFIESDGSKRIIKKGNSLPMNFLHVSTTKGIYLDSRNIKTTLVNYNDYVYCVEVPNHIFYVRDNGKACWNGNSSVISGDRISHNIIETWWEGHTLMGKMEILMTRGYKKFGIVSTKGDQTAWLLENNIMIGVSSRGVGSLKEVKGDFIVQDDFELICWDVVTAPSTPVSWIFKDKAEARPYVESLLIKKPSLNENLDRFLLNL